jgi:hypothetical protein
MITQFSDPVEAGMMSYFNALCEAKRTGVEYRELIKVFFLVREASGYVDLGMYDHARRNLVAASIILGGVERMFDIMLTYVEEQSGVHL